MNVYAFQMDIVWEDKQANFDQVLRWIEQTTPQPGSLIVLPEMFATGFSMNAAVTQEVPSGPSTAFLVQLAKETSCYVLGGLTTSRPEGKPTNDAILVRPDGTLAGSYSKIHPFSMGKEGEHYAAGGKVCSFELDGGWILCPFICYDLRFPEIFREAMLAEHPPHLFVVIANWPNKRTQHWERLLEARAIENLAYVVGVNRCGSDPYLDYDGSTMIIDPLGNTLAHAGNQAGVVQADIQLHEVEAWRKNFPALQDRRPHMG